MLDKLPLHGVRVIEICNVAAGRHGYMSTSCDNRILAIVHGMHAHSIVTSVVGGITIGQHGYIAAFCSDGAAAGTSAYIPYPFVLKTVTLPLPPGLG